MNLSKWVIGAVSALAIGWIAVFLADRFLAVPIVNSFSFASSDDVANAYSMVYAVSAGLGMLIGFLGGTALWKRFAGADDERS